MGLMITKIFITIFIVVLLAEVSKRTNPFFGGILLGLPLGVGLSVYFISYSEGVQYVVKGIPWGLAGLAPSILFCLFYLIGGRVFKPKNKIVSIVVSSALGFIFFFFIGFLLYMLKLSIFIALTIFIIFYIINIVIVRRFAIQNASPTTQKPTNTYITILIRGLISGIMIAMFTGIAAIVGSKWAGILSAFPATTYALVLVLHYEYGNDMYPSVIYGFSYSVSTLAVFYISCWYLLPIFGLNIGFIMSYIICLGYLFILKAVTDRFLKKEISKV